MRRIAFRLVFIASTSALCLSGSFAQEQEKAPQPAAQVPCPQLTIATPAGGALKEGESVLIAANLSGGDSKVAPTFVWSTSAGTIVKGQGTRSLTIDSRGSGFDRQIGVDLWVGGYAPECTLQASAMIKVIPPPVKVLEFGEMAADKEAEMIRSFAQQAQASPDNIYVFGYAGRKDPRGFANTVLKRIKAQLIDNGLRYERMGFIDGGYREESAFEIWIVPVGADAPRAKPTVAAKDIVFPKTSPPPAKKP